MSVDAVATTERAYAGEQDLAPMAELINAVEAFDRTGGGASIRHLRDDLRAPGMDPAGDVRLWQAGASALTALAILEREPPGDFMDAVLNFFVRPEQRNAGLENAIVDWAAARMRGLGRQHGVPARLLAGVNGDLPDKIATLERLGFEVVRYFVRMRRSLEQPIPEPALPTGFVLRALAGAEEVPAWVELFNRSFVDHFNHHDLTVENRLHWFTERHYRAEQDLVAVAPDGTLAAFCKCFISDEQNERNGSNTGWISLLGTRRGYRNIGLGRAMLLAGLQRLRRDGADTAMLGVDADSPTGAPRLYAAAGFEVVHRRIAFHKDL